MIRSVIRFSLKHRMLVVAMAAMVFVYGMLVIWRLPIDVFPDLNRPTVTIMTESHGLAPEEVETLVTLPIEWVMNGAPGVNRVRSASAPGLSIVWVEFDWGTDIYLDRQLVAERLQVVRGRMPEGVVPTLSPVSSIMGEIMLISMHSKGGKTSAMDVRTLADWVVRPQLVAISGIAQVIAMGGEVKQYQVHVSPHKLAEYGITFEDVAHAVQKFGTNTTGGFLDIARKEHLIRNIGRSNRLEDIANAVVTYRSDVPVLVKHVAEVRLGPQVKRGDASVNATPAVILTIQKQPGADTVSLTRKVETALDDVQKSLPPDVVINKTLFRQSDFIESAVGNISEALRDGALIVLVVLFLFLLNLRTTFITLTAIPLSFVVTALVFQWFGMTINTMTLGGLAVAIGELVDDAIVDVENVFRRLRENRQSATPRSVLSVVYDASLEIRGSIVFSTIIVVLVFIPLFSLSGIEGRLFMPLGISYIVSILASLGVSLTVTPVLCSYLLPKARFMERKRDSPLVRLLKWLDTRLLTFTLAHPAVVMGVVLVMVGGAAATVPWMGRAFLPDFNEGSATIALISMPGTSLEESNRMGSVAERLLLTVPEVVSTGRRTGRAEQDEHAEGVHSSDIEVTFRHSQRSRAEILGEIRQKLSQIPGVVLNIGQPISHRLDHLLSGVRAQIAVKIFGSDLATLRGKAQEVEQVMETVPGVVDLQVEKQIPIHQLQIRASRDVAPKYGIQVGSLMEVLGDALHGEVVNQVLEEKQAFDVVVRFDDSFRQDIPSIENALMTTPSGARVPLKYLADVVDTHGPNVIQHENAQRRIVVQANVADRDLGSVIDEMQAKIAKAVQLPQGYFIQYGGQFESQQKASRIIAFLGMLALLGMFLVLYAHFHSTVIVLQILVNIPLALIGSVAAIWLTDGILSVASLVAFVTLAGIASRNTIMMISHYLHLMAVEGEKFDAHMIVRGSLERLVPVLMTALTAMLALTPLMMAKGEPGKEILHPIACVIFGGLLSSTLLDMAVTPAVFYRFGRKSAERFVQRKTEEEI